MIAILAAILFPVFAKAREKARQSSCLSNVKQLALANLQYAQDYDEKSLPYSVYTSGGPPFWSTLVQPYIKNTQILLCPSQRPTSGIGGFVYSYGITRSTGCLQDGTANGVALGSIAYPAETFLFLDTRYLDDEAQGIGTFYGPPGNALGSYGCCSNRHNDGTNCGFYDGHAKWMSRTAAWNSGYYDFN